MQIIPFKTPGSWIMQISLTGQIFLLQFHWNALNAYWIMDILDANGNVIIYGIKVVPNFDLTAQFVIDNLPAGAIVCQNILGQWGDIERFDMGETCELIYYEPAELAVIHG
jgi:hypothetical protein